MKLGELGDGEDKRQDVFIDCEAMLADITSVTLLGIRSPTCARLRNLVEVSLDQNGALQGDTWFPGCTSTVPLRGGRSSLLLDTNKHLCEQEAF